LTPLFSFFFLRPLLLIRLLLDLLTVPHPRDANPFQPPKTFPVPSTTPCLGPHIRVNPSRFVMVRIHSLLPCVVSCFDFLLFSLLQVSTCIFTLLRLFQTKDDMRESSVFFFPVLLLFAWPVHQKLPLLADFLCVFLLCALQTLSSSLLFYLSSISFFANPPLPGAQVKCCLFFLLFCYLSKFTFLALFKRPRFITERCPFC